MLIIGPPILSPAGEDRDAKVFDQGGSHVILGAQGVASAQGYLGTPALERP
jgi:hypothetical protein